ncbi:MAG: hypothetical protein ISR47_00730 [Rhodospirillales bacterium]|nr:hypothetical protein [Rhodospirillales bacterium]
MIGVLVPEFSMLEYMPYGAWALGAIIVVGGFFAGSLRFIVIAVGLAVPFLGTASIDAQKKALSFDVTVLEEAADGVEWRTFSEYRAGTYTFRDGTVAPVSRPEGGRRGTVVVNETTQSLILYIVPYATAAIGRNFPAITWEVGWTVPPVSTLAIPRTIGHVGAKDSPLPDTIMSHTDLDTLIWLTWE